MEDGVETTEAGLLVEAVSGGGKLLVWSAGLSARNGLYKSGTSLRCLMTVSARAEVVPKTGIPIYFMNSLVIRPLPAQEWVAKIPG